MNKENLSIELIKKELNKHFCKMIGGLCISALFVPVGNFLFRGIITAFTDSAESFTAFFSYGYYLIFGLLFVYEFVRVLVALRRIRQGCFSINSDWVVDKIPGRCGTRVSSPKPYVLIFAKSGRYRIPYGDNYGVSSEYPTADKDIYETTALKDEFYVISVGRRKNVLAYNQKRFQLER